MKPRYWLLQEIDRYFWRKLWLYKSWQSTTNLWHYHNFCEANTSTGYEVNRIKIISSMNFFQLVQGAKNIIIDIPDCILNKL